MDLLLRDNKSWSIREFWSNGYKMRKEGASQTYDTPSSSFFYFILPFSK